MPVNAGRKCPARNGRMLRTGLHHCQTHTSRSLPGLTPQVGFTRLAAPSITELGQARVPMQSIVFQKMDARVISAFTRVLDALLPAHDGRG